MNDTEWRRDICTYNPTTGFKELRDICARVQKVTVSTISVFPMNQHLVHFCDSAIIHLAQSVKVHPEKRLILLIHLDKNIKSQ